MAKPSMPQRLPAGAPESVFFPSSLCARIHQNAAHDGWAAQVRQEIVHAAEPWADISDDWLWHAMFGNTISRSWMVWSNGYCPSCRQDVRMYNWQIDAFQHPWKLRCPHCQEAFPKNNFAAFYRTGLDERNVFDPQRVDRALLFNAQHPDPDDPLYHFGVDDGEGYVERDAKTGTEKRWRFIGTYLIYGQWKQIVVNGICTLAAAYVMTGDLLYAHKAGVLLDRVADLYPTFDFQREGVMYEGPGAAGYVSTWHDACEETRLIALAYDQVRAALAKGEGLVTFLASKALRYRLDNPKASFRDVQRNIEQRILHDAAANPQKIHSNYPRTDIALITIQAILGWTENRERFYTMLDRMLTTATAVDGVTGEKGLDAYAAGTIQSIAPLLAMFARIDPGFLEHVYRRHPRLHDAYRFHIDTWCMGQYYPRVGDCGFFARKSDRYAGLHFPKNDPLRRNPAYALLDPSMYAFLWRLYELTGDAAFVQVLYHANESSVEGLPRDVLEADAPETFRQRVQEVIERVGPMPTPGSIDKQEWHLALLRSGRGEDERVLWLTYDSGGSHSHRNGMNLGLFAKGLDLMPDFGYPLVQYGGWSGPKFDWYLSTCAHNTVLVDGQNQPGTHDTLFAGQTTLWADGQRFHAMRASGPDLNQGRRFERTVALVDLSGHDAYVFDVFRVAGGKDHIKFQHSHFGHVATHGLSLRPASDREILRQLGPQAQMRDFSLDPRPQIGWSVDWSISDLYGYLPEAADVHLRYTDLTQGAQALICEGWVTRGIEGPSAEVWIPRVLVRCQANSTAGPAFCSTFVALVEPYEKRSSIAQIRRLPLQTDRGDACDGTHVAVQVQLVDGRRDLLVALDPERLSGSVTQPDWNLRLDGEMCMVRRGANGRIDRLVLCKGRSLVANGVALRLKRSAELIEVSFEGGRPAVVAGYLDDVHEIFAS